MATMSAMVSLATTPFIIGAIGPFRAPVWKSMICRVIWLGERPADRRNVSRALQIRTVTHGAGHGGSVVTRRHQKSCLFPGFPWAHRL